MALTNRGALPDQLPFMVDGDGLLLGRGVWTMKLYEWELLGNYGSGWDLLTTADSRREILQLEKDYQLNDPTTPLKIKSVRVSERVFCGDCLRSDCKGCE